MGAVGVLLAAARTVAAAGLSWPTATRRRRTLVELGIRTALDRGRLPDLRRTQSRLGLCAARRGRRPRAGDMFVVLSWGVFVPLAHMLSFAPGQGWFDFAAAVRVRRGRRLVRAARPTWCCSAARCTCGGDRALWRTIRICRFPGAATSATPSGPRVIHPAPARPCPHQVGQPLAAHGHSSAGRGMFRDQRMYMVASRSTPEKSVAQHVRPVRLQVRVDECPGTFDLLAQRVPHLPADARRHRDRADRTTGDTRAPASW